MAGRPPRALEIDVLQAALEVFCAQGIEAPLKTVGERVGISASAISQRFGSKHDLVQRALESASLCPTPPAGALLKQSIRCVPRQIRCLLRALYHPQRLACD